MMMPSQKLWMLSPTSTLQPPRPACSASKWWWWWPSPSWWWRVAVQLGLFQQEEEQQPASSVANRVRLDLAFEGFGQHVQQRRASNTPADRLTRMLHQPAQHA
jgi:hypothetical protein